MSAQFSGNFAFVSNHLFQFEELSPESATFFKALLYLSLSNEFELILELEMTNRAMLIKASTDENALHDWAHHVIFLLSKRQFYTDNQADVAFVFPEYAIDDRLNIIAHNLSHIVHIRTKLR